MLYSILGLIVVVFSAFIVGIGLVQSSTTAQQSNTSDVGNASTLITIKFPNGTEILTVESLRGCGGIEWGGSPLECYLK
jgi:hypothetical protein